MGDYMLHPFHFILATPLASQLYNVLLCALSVRRLPVATPAVSVQGPLETSAAKLAMSDPDRRSLPAALFPSSFVKNRVHCNGVVGGGAR